jgi:hypothetical protein
MLRTKSKVWLCLTAAAATLSILLVGCGSSSNPAMTNNSMSPAQAQAVTHQVVQALTESLGTALPASTPATGRKNLAIVVSDLHPDTSSGCTSGSTGVTCNWPISLPDDPCSGPAGGTISVTGDVSGTLSNNESGPVNGQFTITPTNCSVSNLIINGDPSINLTGQINFDANLNPAFPIVFTETGGISYGPDPSGSCQLNATYTINSSLACTVSGTVCGQSVSGSC